MSNRVSPTLPAPSTQPSGRCSSLRGGVAFDFRPSLTVLSPYPRARPRLLESRGLRGRRHQGHVEGGVPAQQRVADFGELEDQCVLGRRNEGAELSRGPRARQLPAYRRVLESQGESWPPKLRQVVSRAVERRSSRRLRAEGTNWFAALRSAWQLSPSRSHRAE